MRGQRARRGAAAAGFATFVALASHVIAGGGLPTAMGVVVPLVLSTLICVLLSGRRLSLPRLTSSVLVSQSLFHLLFSVFTPMGGIQGATNAAERHALHHSGPAGLSGMAGMPGMSGTHDMPGMSGTHDIAGMAHGASGAMPASSPETGMHTHMSPGMLIAHLVAAVLTIAMIYWAEALPAKITAFLRVVIHALLPTLIRLTAVPHRPRPRLGVVEILPRHLGVLRSPVPNRGPPATAL